MGAKKEILWKQRTKALWLKEGDRNTSFLHAKANKHRLRKEIKKTTNEQGVEVTDIKEIWQVILRYFQSIFASTNPTNEAIEVVLWTLEWWVTTTMNNTLVPPFTLEEIKLALKQMHPLKSSGPNGSFNPLMNFTHIVLIPKCTNPSEMSHFPPISLCNIVYKLTSKTIANRIKPFLDKLISNTQAVFVPGRLITDNILVAYELKHFLKHKNKGKKRYVSLKLDISKAYDRVEWSFLESVLNRLGFHPRFVSLIMTCVTTVSFSYLLNGKQFGFLKQERGLWQEDHLPAYLFLICTEAFSRMIRMAETKGRIEGIAVSRLVPIISHLLFADDTLVFCQATPEALSCIQGIILAFEKAWGLKINTHKLAKVFSRNVEEDSRMDLSNIVGVTVVPKHDKNLSLLMIAGRSKKELFEGIKDRIWRKLHSWLAKKLSQVGRVVLVKIVLQTTPIYAMSYFRLLDSFLSEIENTMANFFWHGGNESKIHWMAWTKLC
ncbi:UNVERIFIED_CONTAM: hypothetical protein Slati_3861500 [Sesamum latifolium]|uniref:Reverse transcriptase domain-containing protein n=1 Tax=Sesamum latifolium TaxID=2727402 RepID=A0AAW2TPD4_9LAMI